MAAYKIDNLILLNFRDIINKTQVSDYLYKKGVWDKICASMDSIDVAIGYINRISWNDYRFNGFAFQLIDILTGGQMIKKAVNNINWCCFDKNYDLANDISVLKNQYKLTDDQLFAEYRALVFAHSIDFDKGNKISKDAKSYFAWCVWGQEKNNNKIAYSFVIPKIMI